MPSHSRSVYLTEHSLEHRAPVGVTVVVEGVGRWTRVEPPPHRSHSLNGPQGRSPNAQMVNSRLPNGQRAREKTEEAIERTRMRSEFRGNSQMISHKEPKFRGRKMVSKKPANSPTMHEPPPPPPTPLDVGSVWWVRATDGRTDDGTAWRIARARRTCVERNAAPSLVVVVVAAIPKKAAKNVSCHNTAGLDCRR